MPFLTIHTNREVKDSNAFLKEAAQFVAAELHKPISYVIVILDYNPQMIFGGNPDVKSALVDMQSIGFANKGDWAAKLTDFLATKLQLEKSSLNILFTNISGADLSIGGSMLG